MIWSHRLLCAFSTSQTTWAERHCAPPNEEDHERKNIFGKEDDKDEANDGTNDGAEDGTNDAAEDEASDNHDNPNEGSEGDDRNGRNSTEDDTPNENQPNPQSTAPTRPPANLQTPYCTPSQDGSFFVSSDAQQNRATAQQIFVTFAYQVQGSIELNVATLRNNVMPLLEQELSRALIPAIFAPQACQFTPEQIKQQQQLLPPRPSVTTYGFTVMPGESTKYSAIQDDEKDPFHHRTLQTIGEGPANAPVTGLEAGPDDRLLPNYDGVRCRTELLNEADRCYILTGAYTLSGPENIDWAWSLAQETTRKVINDDAALDSAHALIKHVLYLDAIDPNDLPWLFDIGHPPVLIDAPQSVNSNRLTATGVWLATGVSLAILLAIIALLWRRRQRHRGSYDDSQSRTTACFRNGHLSRRRITRGYLAYPSPDFSPDHRPPRQPHQSVWLADNPSTPDDYSQDFLSSPPLSWAEMAEEPVRSFDPVLGPPVIAPRSQRRAVSTTDFLDETPLTMPAHGSSDSPRQTQNITTWSHDGSFPSFSDQPPTEPVINDLENDDIDAAGILEEGGKLSFYNDDDDDDSYEKNWRPSSPNESILRDLV